MLREHVLQVGRTSKLVLADEPSPTVSPGTPDAATAMSPRGPRRLRIYVYDVPNAFSRRRCPSRLRAARAVRERNCTPRLIHNADWFFLSHLISDSATLTREPAEADLLYAPVPVVRNGMLLSTGAPCCALGRWHVSNRGSGAPLHALRAISGGGLKGPLERHIWFALGDTSTCAMPAEVRRGFVLGLWGELRDPRPGDQHGKPCVRIGRDVVLPPVNPNCCQGRAWVADRMPLRQRSLAQRAAATFAAPFEPDASLRPTLALFAGDVRAPRLPSANHSRSPTAGLPADSCARPENDRPECRGTYSMGVRAALWLTLRSEPDCVIVDGHLPDYFKAMQRARFCLDATGAGFAARVPDYVAAGCVPVVIAEDVLWPFEGTARVPYDEFALRFRKREIPTLATALRELPAERLAALQRGLERWHRVMIWDGEYGQAYQTTLAVLDDAVRARWPRRPALEAPRR